MADVFVGCASQDRERAALLAQALQARGWSVWWERHSGPGLAAALAAEHELDSARCVVVLWSQHSVESVWAKNAAAAAAERGALVPARLDAATPPPAFQHRHTADLSNWTGASTHPGLLALCDGVAVTLGLPRARPPLPVARIPGLPQGSRWLPPALAGMAIALALVVYRCCPASA